MNRRAGRALLLAAGLLLLATGAALNVVYYSQGGHCA